MASPDLEDIVDKVIQVFQNQFPEALQTVDQAKTTPYSPRSPLDYIFGDVVQTPQMPSIVFVGRQTKEQSDNPGWRNQTYTIEIEAYYTEMDVRKLNRIIRRYGDAIDTVLRANQTLGGISRNLTNISQNYYNTMKGPSALFQAVNVTFDVTVITN